MKTLRRLEEMLAAVDEGIRSIEEQGVDPTTENAGVSIVSVRSGLTSIKSGPRRAQLWRSPAELPEADCALRRRR